MNQPSASGGIDRSGVDAAFEARESEKGNLILQARLLREQGQHEAAAERFAQAAVIEEELADRCAGLGLVAKELVHRYSAAGCRAQAGDFHHAITLCEGLLARADLPERLREQIGSYTTLLRARRSAWYAELLAQSELPVAA